MLISQDAPTTPSSAEVLTALDSILASLEQITLRVTALREQVAPPSASPGGISPKDPANKFEIGGLEKLTPQGVEVCYRLFDQGKSRYAVAQAMDISFGAATHRYAAWQKAGGANRKKQPL